VKRPRILLADDHAMVLDGLRRIFDEDYEILDAVTDGHALVDAYRRHRPDAAIVDISMPGLNGIDAMRKILASDPTARLIMLTMHNDHEYAAAALRDGARGYVIKAAAADELVLALRSVLRGGCYISPAVSGELLAAPAANRPAPDLTLRQREVLQLMAEGHRVKTIAKMMHISPKTVEYHKYRLMRQLHLRTTAEAVQYAVRHGIIDSSQSGDT
jgi:DNA-binding NarL/FixJ family response regulator